MIHRRNKIVQKLAYNTKNRIPVSCLQDYLKPALYTEADKV